MPSAWRCSSQELCEQGKEELGFRNFVKIPPSESKIPLERLPFSHRMLHCVPAAKSTAGHWAIVTSHMLGGVPCAAGTNLPALTSSNHKGRAPITPHALFFPPFSPPVPFQEVDRILPEHVSLRTLLSAPAQEQLLVP